MAAEEPSSEFKLISVADFAKHLHMNKKALYNHIRRRSLGESSGVYHLGRMIRIDPSIFLHADHSNPPTKRARAKR